MIGIMRLLGDCRDERLVEEIFGTVSEFARLVEECGDEFEFGRVSITYNVVLDIHYFWI